MNTKGQMSFATLIYAIMVIMIVGGVVYAFSPVISAFWDINSGMENYGFFRVLIDLWPVWIVMFILVALFLTRQNAPG